MDRHRILALDSFRGFLIFLVVLGHVVGAAYHLAVEQGQTNTVSLLASYIYKWIYLFHMSAFFFVSGIFFKGENSFRQFLKKYVKRLLIPYFSTGLLFLCVYLVCGATFMPKTAYYAEKFSGGSVFMLFVELLYGSALHYGDPAFVYNAVLWFPPALFSATLIYFGLCKCLHTRRSWLWFLICVIIVVAWFLSTRCRISLPYGITRAMGYLPFFMLGNLLPAKEWTEAMRKCIHKYWIWFPIAAFFSAIVWYMPDLMYRYYSFGHYLVFFAIACIGIVMALFISIALDSRILRRLGCASLTIMLFHKPIVVLLQFACPTIRGAFVKGWPIAIMVSMALTVTSIACCLVADCILRRWMPWLIGDAKK